MLASILLLTSKWTSIWSGLYCFSMLSGLLTLKKAKHTLLHGIDAYISTNIEILYAFLLR